MLSILVVGFFLGVQHAMEADHVAAVASIASGQKKASSILQHGAFWGLGHAVALSAFAGIVVMARGQIPTNLAAMLEFLVGLMLIGLGSMVIWRLIRQRAHFHLHHHSDGKIHFHMHEHRDDKEIHDENKHSHDHQPHGIRRSLIVGLMHGIAGSAALVALAAPGKWVEGMGFVLLFGLGSIIGMVLMTSVVAVPMMFAGGIVTGLNRMLQGVIGIGSIMIGCFYAYDQMPVVLETVVAL